MDGVAITGVDGWGDARLGNPEGTDVRLNDFLMIRDLATPDWNELLARLRRLGDREAELAQVRLDEAFQLAKHVLFVTHVPPFRAACWHDGEVSNDEWLPFFTCDAVGKVLRHAARENPDRHITVLCGHTHSAGEVHVGPNLHVFTGRADYGTPAFDLLEVSATGVGFAD
jgi:3',5'-cyclic AMP phosphodiesterase CpdA